MRHKFNFFVFIGIVSTLLFLINAVIYNSFIFAFHYGNGSSSIIFVFALLYVSLLSSFIFSSQYYNRFTRTHYYLSMVWFGCLGYLFLTSFLYLLFVAVSGENFSTLGEVLFVGSIIASFYGLYVARQLRIKNIVIEVDNLPEIWHQKKIAWISDVHLGQIYGKEYAQKIVNMVKEINPEALCVGGDLFDGTTAPDCHDLVAPFKELAAIMPVYFITGNHEEFNDDSVFLQAVRGVGMIVLSNEVVELRDMQFVGVDFKNTQKRNEYMDVFSRITLTIDKPAILLKHEPKDIDVAELHGISLQISGHTHNAQMWPFTYMVRRMYKGYEYGHKMFKKMHVYTSSGAGTWGPPMRVGTQCEIAVFHFIKSRVQGK